MRRPLILISLVLAGCTVGPDYGGPPTVAVSGHPEAVFRRADPAHSTTAPPIAHWWSLMADERLTALIERALKASPDIVIAEARVRRARAALREQRAGQFPSLSASSTAIVADLPAGSLALPPQDDQDKRVDVDLYNMGLNASWEIDLFGGKRRAAESASAQREATQASLADAQVRLSVEVASNYVTLRELQQRMILQQTSAELQRQLVELTEQREMRGASSRDDVVRQQTELNKTMSSLVSIEAHIAISLDQIALLTGDEPGAHDATLAAPAPIPSIPVSVAIGDPTAMLRRRPDIRIAERQLAAANAQIGVDVARQFPSVSIMGIIGLGGPKVGDVFDIDQVSTLMLPRINWSFLNFGTNQARVDQSRAGRDEAAEQYRKAVLAALSDANQSLTLFGNERAKLVASIGRSNSAHQSARYAAQRFEVGAVPLTASLDAQRLAIAADEDTLMTEAEMGRAFLNLQKSLGMGWDNPAN